MSKSKEADGLHELLGLLHGDLLTRLHHRFLFELFLVGRKLYINNIVPSCRQKVINTTRTRKESYKLDKARHELELGIEGSVARLVSTDIECVIFAPFIEQVDTLLTHFRQRGPRKESLNKDQSGNQISWRYYKEKCQVKVEERKEEKNNLECRTMTIESDKRSGKNM